MIQVRNIFAIILATLMFFGAGVSEAQESVKDLATRASNEMSLLISFRNMERSLGEMDHILTYGIVASTGGWGVLDFVDTTDYSNSYALRGKVGDVQIVAARANAAIQRSKISTDDQKERARDALDGLEEIFAATSKIADALAAEDLGTAREIYRDECQKPYEEALRTIQSAGLELEKQLSSTILKLRVTK